MCSNVFVHIEDHRFSRRIVLISLGYVFTFARNTLNRGFAEKTTGTHSPHICEQIWHMSSIGDYRKIMDGLDGWNEAAGFVRPDDVERWNADDQITLKTFPILLNMSIKAPTVRSQLLADNLLLIGVAESAATHNDPQEQPSAKADEPEAKKPEEERPREDFSISLDYWTDLTQVFCLGQNENMADSLLHHIKKGASKEVVMEKRGANFSYADVRAYDGPQGEQCVQMCSNVF